ncbi:MAG: hydrogenase/urease maturation nickel metallochaperone HypA [archaeon]
MHEITICKQLLNQLDKYKNIKSITLEVGTLAPLTKQELKETMETLVNYKVNVIEKEARVKCLCKYKGSPHIIQRGHDFVLFDCPTCGKNPTIIDGNKIIIKNIEIS